jgi:hypothetical protein
LKLRQAEEIKENEEEINIPRREQVDLIMKDYDKILRGE